ncbi:hypothetical protein SUDANB108_00119 [Streptomyces sp. enrichment culture]
MGAKPSSELVTRYDRLAVRFEATVLIAAVNDRAGVGRSRCHEVRWAAAAVAPPPTLRNYLDSTLAIGSSSFSRAFTAFFQDGSAE